MPAAATAGSSRATYGVPLPRGRGAGGEHHQVAITQPSSSDGVATSARARPGERSSRRPAARPGPGGGTRPPRPRRSTPGSGRRRGARPFSFVLVHAVIVPSLHRPPRNAARSRRRARWARLFTVPTGTPISSAASATGRSST